MQERFTDALAFGGATSYFWTEPFNNNILVPVATTLGIIWLLIQIYLKIEERLKKNDDDKNS